MKTLAWVRVGAVTLAFGFALAALHVADRAFVSAGAADAQVAENRIVKLHLVEGDTVHTTCVEVPHDLVANRPGGNKALENSTAVLDRLSDVNRVEEFKRLGTATYLSPTQMAIELADESNFRLPDCLEKISADDPDTRRAVMLIPRSSSKSESRFFGRDHAELERELAPVLRDGG